MLFLKHTKSYVLRVVIGQFIRKRSYWNCILGKVYTGDFHVKVATLEKWNTFATTRFYIKFPGHNWLTLSRLGHNIWRLAKPTIRPDLTDFKLSNHLSPELCVVYVQLLLGLVWFDAPVWGAVLRLFFKALLGPSLAVQFPLSFHPSIPKLADVIRATPKQREHCLVAHYNQSKGYVINQVGSS